MLVYGVKDLRKRRFDSKKWPLMKSCFHARSSEEIAAHAKPKKFICKSEPLFSFIPIDHVMIDPLYLFLRISDYLSF